MVDFSKNRSHGTTFDRIHQVHKHSDHYTANRSSLSGCSGRHVRQVSATSRSLAGDDDVWLLGDHAGVGDAVSVYILPLRTNSPRCRTAGCWWSTSGLQNRTFADTFPRCLLTSAASPGNTSHRLTQLNSTSCNGRRCEHLFVRISITLIYNYVSDITFTDLSPVPVRSAMKSNFTSWSIQNLSKRALNTLTELTSGFSVATVNIFSLVNKMMLTSSGEYFSATVLNGWVLRGSSLHSALGHCNFWAQTFQNLLLSLSVTELWKSVSIWQSCTQKYSGIFFPDTVYLVSQTTHCCVAEAKQELISRRKSSTTL